jgi:hypothetical protein
LENGPYNFLQVGDWDSMMFLYINSFDSGNPLTNCLIGNGEYPPGLPVFGLSGFTYNLTSGTNYYAVATGFETETGTYRLDINGPGSITLT